MMKSVANLSQQSAILSMPISVTKHNSFFVCFVTLFGINHIIGWWDKLATGLIVSALSIFAQNPLVQFLLFPKKRLQE